MRFHSLVLSILAGVPAVPIAYGHKTFSLAEMCGLKDYTLIWNTFQEEYYGEKIDASSEQILKKLMKCVLILLMSGKGCLSSGKNLLLRHRELFRNLMIFLNETSYRSWHKESHRRKETNGGINMYISISLIFN